MFEDVCDNVETQDANGTYARALSELRAGAKRSHWMSFVFPQLAGLGSSPMAQRYAIGSLDEARDYWRHPVLLRSSLTLFLRAAPGKEALAQALDRWFGGVADERTDALLSGSGVSP